MHTITKSIPLPIVLFSLLKPSLAIIFNTHLDGSPGNCASANNNGFLQRDYQESWTLSSAGLFGLNNYANDLVVRQLMTAYFGILPNAQGNAPLPQHQQYFAKISSFMNAHSSFLNGQLPEWMGGHVPQLYCDSSFIQMYSWSDQALDAKDHPVVDANNNPVPFSVAYAADHRAHPNVYPGWVDEWEDLYLMPNPIDYCSARQANGDFAYLGLTTIPATIPPATMIICPQSYTWRKGVASLNVPALLRPAVGTSIDDVRPYSSTYFHEVHHLVQGLGWTDDTYPSLQLLLRGARNGELDALSKDPEPYVYFCLAYWLSMLQFKGQNGNLLPRMNFATGRMVEI